MNQDEVMSTSIPAIWPIRIVPGGRSRRTGSSLDHVTHVFEAIRQPALSVA